MTTVVRRRAAGKTLMGMAISETAFLGVSTLNQLITFGLVQPSFNEHAKTKEMRHDPALAKAHGLRETVQRRFDTPRLNRAHHYSDYIERVNAGTALGGTPPITLYCPDAGQLGADEASLTLPAISPLVNLDGETQTEARFLLRERDEATGDDPVPFVLYHGIAAEHAGTIMHDFNKYAHPVKERAVAVLNANGPLTKAINESLAAAAVSPIHVARFKNTPSKGQLVAYQSLLAGAAGAAIGLTGLPQLSAQIAHLNNGAALNPDDVQRFLVPALELAKAHPDVGRSRAAIWALMGAVAKDHGKQPTETEWMTAAAAYGVKIDGLRGPKASRMKEQAALKVMGIAPATASAS
jgi:hypothetical protein